MTTSRETICHVYVKCAKTPTTINVYGISIVHHYHNLLDNSIRFFGGYLYAFLCDLLEFFLGVGLGGGLHEKDCSPISDTMIKIKTLSSENLISLISAFYKL
jgi:hypothetical protein